MQCIEEILFVILLFIMPLFIKIVKVFSLSIHHRPHPSFSLVPPFFFPSTISMLLLPTKSDYVIVGFLAAPHGLRYLSSPSRAGSLDRTLETPNPKHWTVREVPAVLFEGENSQWLPCSLQERPKYSDLQSPLGTSHLSLLGVLPFSIYSPITWNHWGKTTPSLYPRLLPPSGTISSKPLLTPKLPQDSAKVSPSPWPSAPSQKSLPWPSLPGLGALCVCLMRWA